MPKKKILLIITGSVSSYKGLYLIRLLKKEGLRYTKQRLAILKQIETSSGHHDAESIYSTLKSKKLNIIKYTC